MSDLNDMLFSPLDRRFCDYFYYLQVFSFILFLFTLLSVVMLLVNKKINWDIAIYSVLYPFIMYFTHRIFYSMCIR